ARPDRQGRSSLCCRHRCRRNGAQALGRRRLAGAAAPAFTWRRPPTRRPAPARPPNLLHRPGDPRLASGLVLVWVGIGRKAGCIMRKNAITVVLVSAFLIAASSWAKEGSQRIAGTVESRTGQQVKVRTPEGRVITIGLTKGTRKRKGSGTAALSDVKAGARGVVE